MGLRVLRLYLHSRAIALARATRWTQRSSINTYVQQMERPPKFEPGYTARTCPLTREVGVVLDTNTLVSAALRADSVPGMILARMQERYQGRVAAAPVNDASDEPEESGLRQRTPFANPPLPRH